MARSLAQQPMRPRVLGRVLPATAHGTREANVTASYLMCGLALRVRSRGSAFGLVPTRHRESESASAKVRSPEAQLGGRDGLAVGGPNLTGVTDPACGTKAAGRRHWAERLLGPSRGRTGDAAHNGAP